MSTSKYAHYVSVRATPQSLPIPGKKMVANEAGGFGFPVDDWCRLDRWLYCGAQDGTYYISEQKLVLENADAVIRCIVADGIRVVNRILEISEKGTTAKVSPTLFALALCIAKGNLETRQAAYAVLPRIARTASHLFELIENAQHMRGWGRGFRKAVSVWYNDKPAKDVAYQVVKYRNRSGWTHLDVLCSAHVKPATKELNSIFAYLKTGLVEPQTIQEIIVAYEHAIKAENATDIVEYITEYNLPWEALDTKWLNEPIVWEALLHRIPITAMIRNLGKMTSIGLVAVGSAAESNIVEMLHDTNVLRKGRVHPMNLLAALSIYQQGHGDRGKLTWLPSQKVVDALDNAIYLTMPNVEPTGKRILVGYDCSGSMHYTPVNGMTINCVEAASALGAVFNATTDTVTNVAFSTEAWNFTMLAGSKIVDWSRKLMSYDGGTDCSQPILYAIRNKVLVDAFIIVTDEETWHGDLHPIQALTHYRKEIGINAKLAVVAMAATGSSIADVNEDALSLNVAGFDASVANVIGNFIRE